MKKSFKAITIRFAASLVGMAIISIFHVILAVFWFFSFLVFMTLFVLQVASKGLSHDALIYLLATALMLLITVVWAFIARKILQNPKNSPFLICRKIITTDEEITVFLLGEKYLRIPKENLTFSLCGDGFWISWGLDGKEKKLFIRKWVFDKETYDNLRKTMCGEI